MALVGLVLLAVIGWLVTDTTGPGTQGAHRPQAPISVTVSPSAPTRGDASG